MPAADRQSPPPRLAAVRLSRTWLLRAAGSAIILGLVFWRVPMDGVLEGFASIHWDVFVVVLVAFLCGHALAAAKWWFLLDRCVPFPVALRAHFAGLAANLCLPGVAGGDVVRASLVHRLMGDGARLAAGSLTDRLLDMLALVLLSVAGLMLLQGKVGTTYLAFKLLVPFAVALGCTFYIAPALISWIYTRAPSLPARNLMTRIGAAFGALGQRPLRLCLVTSMSALIQAGFILLAVQLAKDVGLNLPLAAWFFAWPLAKIVAVLPVSLGGLGVREASLAVLLTGFGAAAADVVATSLIWQAVLLCAGLIGAVAWMIGPSFGRSAKETIVEPKGS